MARQPTPTQQATQIVRAQYRPIDYALAQSRANSAKQQAALAATGRALIAQLQGGVKPAGQAYDAAVGQQQALAQGGASLLAGLNPNAQIQNTLNAIGAPQAQKDLVANQTRAQFPGQGAVLNIQQGTIPGASLVAQKAAVQNYLAGLPTIAALGQQRSAQGLAQQQAQNAQQLYGQRLQAASQIPQIAQSIGSSEASQQLALQNFLADQSYRQAELGARSDSQKSLDAYRQQSLQQRRTSSSSAAKTVSFGDTLYRVNANGTLTPLARKPPTSGATKPGTAPTKYKPPTGSDLQKQADLSYYGQEPVVDANGNTTKPGVKAVGYQTALFGMINSGVKLPVAQRYLNQFYAPGERGRPKVPYQQRKARGVTDTGRPVPRKRGG